MHVDRKWSRREERTSNIIVESGSLLSEGIQRSNVEKGARDNIELYYGTSGRLSTGAWDNRNRRECKDIPTEKDQSFKGEKKRSLRSGASNRRGEKRRSLRSGASNRRDVTTPPVEVLEKCSMQSRGSRWDEGTPRSGSAFQLRQ